MTPTSNFTAEKSDFKVSSTSKWAPNYTATQRHVAGASLSHMTNHSSAMRTGWGWETSYRSSSTNHVDRAARPQEVQENNVFETPFFIDLLHKTRKDKCSSCTVCARLLTVTHQLVALWGSVETQGLAQPGHGYVYRGVRGPEARPAGTSRRISSDLRTRKEGKEYGTDFCGISITSKNVIAEEAWSLHPL